MKTFGLIPFLVASWVGSAFGKSNLYSGWTQKFDNTPYPALTAEVGDTITFIWTVDQVQNVFIHPTNDCTQTGRIAVGNTSPTEYTFKPEDGAPEGKAIFFANDIGDRCENYGMRLTVYVFPESDGSSVPGFDSSAAPTDVPLTGTTEAPTDGATLSPVDPTIAPVEPTLAPIDPTGIPTAFASLTPTDVPTGVPTFPSTLPPTGIPTFRPTKIPTGVPTFRPTRTPTEIPTGVPTFPPTLPPTGNPTFTPTSFPTTPPVPFPTLPPTGVPTGQPTNPPTAAPTTSSPTASPTTASPTLFPTEQATDAPTPDDGRKRKTMRGLQMTMSGDGAFSENSAAAWAKETKEFCTSYYLNDIEGSSFTTDILVTSMKFTNNVRRSMRGSRRNLQGASELVLSYNQVVSYEGTGNEFITETYLAKGPFDSLAKREKFVEALQTTNDEGLEGVLESSEVYFKNETPPTMAPVTVTVAPQPQPDPKPKTDPILGLPAIIGIACGGAAVLIIGVLFYCYCRAKRATDETNSHANPPTRNVSIKEDEVSTLAGPSVAGHNPAFGGDRSLDDNVDFDYSKAYGNGQHSVSSAGGTFGSNTQNLSFAANATATGAALGPYGDGGYDDQYRDAGNVQEEVLHIFAPPGKLGVVIDTPDDGAPVVHAVKETSVVVDKVMVGDKLMAVDDEDVRTLTAIKVSKLISRKSANPSRKLTILRTTPIGR